MPELITGENFNEWRRHHERERVARTKNTLPALKDGQTISMNFDKSLRGEGRRGVRTVRARPGILLRWASYFRLPFGRYIWANAQWLCKLFCQPGKGCFYFYIYSSIASIKGIFPTIPAGLRHSLSEERFPVLKYAINLPLTIASANISRVRQTLIRHGGGGPFRLIISRLIKCGSHMSYTQLALGDVGLEGSTKK